MHRLCKYGDACCTGKTHLDDRKWCGHMNWRCLWLPQSWIVVDEQGVQKPCAWSKVDTTGVEPV